MVARSAATAPVITADAVEFIRFCYSRRRLGWPELYDEMCAVASRRLFRGWGPDELASHGIGFGLIELPRLATTVKEIVEVDQARAKGTALPAAPARSVAVA
jgi:hypothetical protein